MQAEEGSDREGNRENGRSKGGPGDRIGIGGGDDAVVRIQLAARWSEAYAPAEGDTLIGVLKRFRASFEYLDAVIHGVEPAEFELDEIAQPSATPAPAPTAAPPAPAPSYSPPTSYTPPPQPPSQPEPEPRSWG